MSFAGAKLYETRNILVVGKGGSGKSTVANRLLCSDKFKVGDYHSHHDTCEPVMCSCEFDHEDIHYRFNVIDTCGLFDSGKLSNKKS